MLRDGQFIKEEPPKIGAHYVPLRKRGLSREEQFMQDILLGMEERRQSILSKLFGMMLRT